MGEVGERKISRTAPGVTIFSQSFFFLAMDILAADRIIVASFLGRGLWVWRLLMSNLWYVNVLQQKLPIVRSCTSCYWCIYLYCFTVACNQMCMALIKNAGFLIPLVFMYRSFHMYSCSVVLSTLNG